MKSLKSKKMGSVCLIAIILILICMVNILGEKEKFYFSGSQAFAENGESGDYVVYENITLKPGVYRVELSYQTEADLLSHCTVKDGTVFSGGLLTNGEHLYSGLGKTSFSFWLFETTDKMEVVIKHSGQGNLITGELIIEETSQLWTMILTIIVFLLFLILGISLIKEYDKIHKIQRESKKTAFFLCLIAILASIPYMLHENISGIDIIYHMMRIEGVKDGLLSGTFPIRIDPKWLYGYGYANSMFYCNIFLIFPAILRILGFTVSASYNSYLIVINIVTVGISYYSFRSIFKNQRIGILCSALYTMSTFRIYKLLVTSALGEGTAFIFMPLVVLGLYRIFYEENKEQVDKSGWMITAIGYAGIIQSHVLTSEITAFLTLIICIFGIKKVMKKETFIQLAKAAIGAIGLSAWYLIPFLDYYLTQNVQIKNLSARTIQDRGLYLPQLAFHFWKLGSNAVMGEEGMQDSYALGVGLVLVIGILVFGILWFSGKYRKADKNYIKLGKVATLMGCGLMFASLHVFPWDKIQKTSSIAAALVSSLQFPHRFLGWATVCLVVVFGATMLYFYENGKKTYFYIGLVCVGIGITTSSMYMTDYTMAEHRKLAIYNEEGMGVGEISGGEYLIENTDREQLTFKEPSPSYPVEILTYHKEYLKVEIECINRSSEEGTIDLPLLLYKGYQAKDQETKEEIQIRYGENNQVQVIIKAGYSGTIQVEFVSPLYWRISELISVIFFVFFTILFIKKIKRRGNVCIEKE